VREKNELSGRGVEGASVKLHSVTECMKLEEFQEG